MFKSLKSKIIIPIVFVLFAMIAIIVIFVAMQTRSLVDDLTQERVSIMGNAVISRLNALQEQMVVVTGSVAGSYEILSSLIDWNAGINREAIRQSLQEYFDAIVDDVGVTNFVVRDAEGIIILRSHDGSFETTPDNALNRYLALQGISNSAFSSTAAMPSGINATVPVWHEGQVIGTFGSNFFLSTDDFVNYFSETFGAQVTVFTGNRRVATTFTDSTGARLVGTYLEDDYIIDKVQNQQLTHTVEQVMFSGGRYYGHFSPLLNASGVAIGMLYVGFPTDSTHIAVNNQRNLVIVIGLIGTGVVVVAMFLTISKSLKPLNLLKTTIKEVSAGNVNVNLDRSNISKDELGELSYDVCGLVDVIKNIVQDLSKAYNEYMKIGNIDYNIDDSKYQNSFKEVIELINTLLTQNTEDVMSLGQALNQISDGDFSVKINESDWPGGWTVLPQRINILTANLTAVSNETNSMIEAAVNGDLSFKTDADRYKGDWHKIMIGLNDIAKAIDAPIQVFKESLEEMKKGNFDLDKIDAELIAKGHDVDVDNYRGVFKSIVFAINETMTDVHSYINELEDILAQMANGNLRNKIEREYVGSFDLIKRSVNTINNTLHKTMTEISVAADQVLAGASQISTSATGLAGGAQEQAGSLQELNATIDIISQQTKQNEKSATTANELSKKSSVNAQEGNEAMKQTVQAMTQIKESSDNISKIIKAIQDIAFQTNLLALNASVEAARAGEHGKGFAVVADEVRTLAGRSQEAANETTTLIQDSIERVETGTGIAGSTAQLLNTIVISSGEVSETIDNISTASQEQTEAIEQISDGLAQISKVTQNNSAVSEETAAAAEELSSQAEMLRQLVSYFKL